jgi:hypothetical protein
MSSCCEKRFGSIGIEGEFEDQKSKWATASYRFLLATIT